MKRSELESFYRKRHEAFSSTHSKLRKQINLYSNLRLLAAAVIILTFYFALTAEPRLFYLFGFEVVVFILLVRKHADLFRAKTHAENLIKIQVNELSGLEGVYDGFNNGAQFINSHHHYTHDLDVFGDGSLFQMLCRCGTLSGQKELAARLANPLLNKPEIERTQAAVKELAAVPEFCHEFEATGFEIGENDNDRRDLLEWLKRPPFLFGNQFYRILLVVLPLLTIGALILAIALDGYSKLFIFLGLVQWIILGFNLKKVNAFHEALGREKNILEKYAELLRVIEQQNFTSPLLV
jgi:hypothetical protein